MAKPNWTPKLADVLKHKQLKFGTRLSFKNVRGGVTTRGAGWYAADDVEVIQVKENA